MTRYESKGGAHWLEHGQPDEHGLVDYKAGDRNGINAAGYTYPTELETRIARGDFQPDTNTTPLRKVSQ